MIVENVQEAVMLGKRIHAQFNEDQFVELLSWHPSLPGGYCPTIEYCYPGQVEVMVAPFRVAEGKWGWAMIMKPIEREFRPEHQGLAYGLWTGKLLIQTTLEVSFIGCAQCQ